METAAFWEIIETARALVGNRANDRSRLNDPLPEVLTAILSGMTPEQIAAFAAEHQRIVEAARDQNLWAAAQLIEGGCSEDGFKAFRDGLILQGRATFESALADPDSLAEHPTVVEMAQERGRIGYESITSIMLGSFERSSGDTDEAAGQVRAASAGTTGPASDPSGQDWELEDEEETARRLPRLSALFR